MSEAAIYKNVELGSIKFERLREELGKKLFTGFVKLSYWNMEDYLYYLRGKPVGGIRYLSEDGGELIDHESYRPPHQAGLLSLYSTSPVEVFAFLESLQEKLSPYSFVSYGREVVASLQLSHTDPQLVLSHISSLEMHGYMVFCGQEGFGPLIGFSAGKPVFLFDRGRKPSAGRVDLHMKLSDACLSVFRTEPEFVNFLASADKMKKVHTTRLSGLQQVREVLKEVRDPYLLLEVILTYGLRLFTFLYKGSVVFKMLSKNGLFSEESPVLSRQRELPLNVYAVPVQTSLSPIEINFLTESSVEYLKTEELSAIKNFFMEHIGPIWQAVWKRVFEKMGLEPDKLPVDRTKEFIKRLAEEIPDERHSKAFLEKTRRWSS